MKIYKYDEKTKEFLYEAEAQLDQLESSLKGKPIYLIPPNSTTIAPPIELAKTKAVFEKDKWELVEDYRGEIFYQGSQEIVYDELGSIDKSKYSKTIVRTFSEEYQLILEIIKGSLENQLNKIRDINGYFFRPSSVESILNTMEESKILNSKVVTRDDKGNVITVDYETLNNICVDLCLFKKLAYIEKWKIENKLKKINSLDKLQKQSKKANIVVKEEELNKVKQMTESQRNNYFIEVCSKIV